MFDFIIVVSVVLILAGFLAPKTTQSKASIILGDKSGANNAIVVSSKESELLVDEPYMMVKLKSDGGISKPVKISSKDLKEQFLDALEAEPKKPYTINLYFENSTKLTPLSLKNIQNIMSVIRDKEPYSIAIGGYTDSKGSEEKNMLISKNRAEFIKNILLENGVKSSSIKVFAYGEKGQLLPTKDDIREVKNRRVEVMVK